MSSQPTRAAADGRAYLDLQRLARQTGRSTQEPVLTRGAAGATWHPTDRTWRN